MRGWSNVLVYITWEAVYKQYFIWKDFYYVVVGIPA